MLIKKNKSKLNTGFNVINSVHRGFNYMFLITLVLIIILPILIILNISFKSNREYMMTSFLSLPENIFNFENYIHFFKRAKLVTGLKNTLILMIIPTFLCIMMGTMVAYVMTRFDFKAKRFILFLYLLASIIPGIINTIPLFVLIKSLGIYNTIFAGILVYAGAGVLDIYIFIQQMEKIPIALDESAIVEGAGHFRVFWKIILPLMKPAIGTVVILRGLFIYNDFITPYYYMPKSSLRTITTAFYNFSFDRSSQWNLMASGIISLIVPALLLYIFLQRYIMAGLTEGSVKG